VERAVVIDDVLVVDDGSTDGTIEALPTDNGVRALRLPRNVGKGGAMWAGAHNTDAEVILFLDADLVGLEAAHLELMVKPVAAGEADMCVGVFSGGRYWTDLAQRLVPYISGQRAVRREMFLRVPQVRVARWAAEVALTRHARAGGWRVPPVPLPGMTHVMKEEKMGPLRGFGARLGMYWEIGAYISREKCARVAGSVRNRLRRLLRRGSG